MRNETENEETTKRQKKKRREKEITQDEDFEIWDEDEDKKDKKKLTSIPKELIDPNAGKHPIELIWGTTHLELEEIKNNIKTFSMKHGMLAGVPLLCKGNKSDSDDNNCAFIDICTVNPLLRRKGSRCQMEIAALVSRFDCYCQQFQVGLGEHVLPEEVTDLTLIRQLCDLEIQILRADNKIAIDGDFIVRNLIDETKKGQPIYEDKVSPATAFKLDLLGRHNKILQLLAATRKDKVNVVSNDASVQASILMKKLKDLEKGDIINVGLTEEDLVNEDGSINFDIINKFIDKEEPKKTESEE